MGRETDLVMITGEEVSALVREGGKEGSVERLLEETVDESGGKEHFVYVYNARVDEERVGGGTLEESFEGEDLLWEAELGARRYYNELVGLENRRRELLLCLATRLLQTDEGKWGAYLEARENYERGERVLCAMLERIREYKKQRQSRTIPSTQGGIDLEGAILCGELPLSWNVNREDYYAVRRRIYELFGALRQIILEALKNEGLRLTVEQVVEIAPELRGQVGVNEEYSGKQLEKLLYEWRKQETKKRRKGCGLYWGTYLLVEAAVERAVRQTLLLADPVRRIERGKRISTGLLEALNSVRSKEFRGRYVHLGIQFQGGITPQELGLPVEGGEIVPATQGTISVGRGRKRIERIRVTSIRRLDRDRSQVNLDYLVAIEQRPRMGGGVGRVGRYTPLRVILHRRFPADVRIKYVHLIGRGVGRRMVYELQFILERAVGGASQSRAMELGAINFGWRAMEDGVRVAYLVTEGTPSGSELKLPRRLVEEMISAYKLRGLIRKRINELTGVLGYFIERNEGRGIPSWFSKRVAALNDKISYTEVEELLQLWRADRFDLRGGYEVLLRAEELKRLAPVVVEADCWWTDTTLGEFVFGDAAARRREVSGELCALLNEVKGALADSPRIAQHVARVVDPWMRGEERLRKYRLRQLRRVLEEERFVLVLTPEMLAEKAPTIKALTGLDSVIEIKELLRIAFRLLTRGWAAVYNHLTDWEANLREQVLCARRDIYRKFAARLRDAGVVLYSPPLETQRFALRPDITEWSNLRLPHNFYRHLAGVSILENCLRNAGVPLKEVNQASTRRCHLCGYVHKGEEMEAFKKQVEVTCRGCGEKWDQDYNSCLNILRFIKAGGVWGR